MRRVSKKIWLAGGVPLAVLLLVWLAWSLLQTLWYTNALPAQLQTQGFVRHSSNFNPLLVFVPMRHEAMGSVVYGMTAETRTAVEQQGLAFLAAARQGRGHPNDFYYSYGGWTPTPVGSDSAKGLFLGAHGIHRELQRKIRQAAQEPGGYYAIKPGAVVLVLPRLGIILMHYNG